MLWKVTTKRLRFPWWIVPARVVERPDVEAGHSSWMVDLEEGRFSWIIEGSSDVESALCVLPEVLAVEPVKAPKEWAKNTGFMSGKEEVMRTPRTVLIVEDEPTIAQVMARALRSEGMSPLLASTVERGVQLLTWNVVDLVVTDLWDVAYTERAWQPVARLREAAPEVPILVCTAHSQAAKDPCFKLWISDVVVKPFDLDDILERIRALVTGSPGPNTTSAVNQQPAA